MSFLDRLTVKSRLFMTLGLVLAMLAGIVAISAWSARANLHELQSLVNGEFAKYRLIAAVDGATKGNARNVLELFLITSAEKQKVIRQRMGETRKNIDGYMQALDGLISMPHGRELFKAIVDKRGQFVQAFTAASEALAQGNLDEGQAIVVSKVLPAIDALQVPIGELMQYQKELADQRALAAEQSIERQITISIGLGLAALLLGVSSALVLIRSIMQPLDLAKSVAQQIGKGNLAVKFDIRGNNELTDMLLALHFMQESLAHLIMRLQESTNSVALSSDEIATANLDLSARTESQASSLEQTAAAMEQLSSSVEQNATATKLANELSERASASANEVGEMVGDVVETMHDIYKSSQRINDIIGVIDSIAFQTNILALNAAVEAARAGEQGRGFAVVASEVRSLAQRSATAAQEIKAIISQNAEKMDLGNACANKASASVSQAVLTIQKVNETVASVSVATREQSIGINQVGQAVTLLDEATQQNAALVEETAAATQNLNEQVQALKATINRFQIGAKTTASFLTT